jgi:hypothetical protein
VRLRKSHRFFSEESVAIIATWPISQPRRRFQFRLRTLMIGVTLLAVVCGYVGRQAEIVRNRRELASRPFVVGLG